MSEYLPANMKSLSDACLVVDALGPLARKDLLDEFVQLQLLPYEKIFSAGEGVRLGVRATQFCQM
jgi:hypothetical protein